MGTFNSAATPGQRGLPGTNGTDGTNASANDFWRSGAGATLPDGTTDVSDAITRTGLTGIGTVPATTPVATLDVAGGARSGVDGRVAGVTPLYVTANIPGIGSGVAPVATPVGGAEFRHSNQSQGVGFAYDGLYATGSVADQSLNFVGKGQSQFFWHWQTLLAGINYTNELSPAIAANQGWNRRQWAASAQVSGRLLRQSTTGVGGTLGMETFWQRLDAAGVFRNALLLYPSVTNASSFSLQIDQDVINDAKLVLFGLKGTTFFGFGIKSATLASFVNASTGFFRWYQGASPGTMVFSVSGAGNVTVDPLGVAPSGFNSPVLRFGSEASTEGIRSQRTTVDRFQNDVETYTASGRRFAVLATGRIYLAVVPVFASDALAGTGGLATGEVFKDALGVLHIKA